MAETVDIVIKGVLVLGAYGSALSAALSLEVPNLRKILYWCIPGTAIPSLGVTLLVKYYKGELEPITWWLAGSLTAAVLALGFLYEFIFYNRKEDKLVLKDWMKRLYPGLVICSVMLLLIGATMDLLHAL